MLDFLKKVLKVVGDGLMWLKGQKKFWAFVGAVIAIAGSYYTGQIPLGAAQAQLLLAILALLGLAGADKARKSL